MRIGPFKTPKSEKANVKVKVRLNLHEFVLIELATLSLIMTKSQNKSYND
jgi:hypothetical protein